MKIRAAMLDALLGLGAGVGSAHAQSRWGDEPGYYEGLPTSAIIRAVRSHGLMPVSRITRRGDLYYVNAADDYGRVRRVMVDAYSGRVVRIEAAERPRRGPGLPPLARPRVHPDDRRDGHAMRRPQPSPPGLPPPPGIVRADPEAFESRLPPRERVPDLPPLRPRANVPASPRTAAVSPTRPPTPRPRPAPAVTAPEPEPAATPEQGPTPQAATPPHVTGSVSPADDRPESEAAERKPLPRVVLPGGPLPKAERTAETRPGQRVPAEGAEAERAPAPAEAAPAVAAQPAPAAEAPPAGLPPVQGLD